MFENEAPSEWWARFYTFLIGLINMLATLSLFPLIDKFGRRKLWIFGSFALFITLAAEGFSVYLLSGTLGMVLSLLFVFIYIIFFEMSIGPLVYIYGGESFYNKGLSMAIGLNWF
mmetsp:Transcript_16506/g.2700  ORF Transcript_16506/g.2700 Transcript_16506/m.2700 type:complete len:115 (-) Transcript_16506:27-371(-)